MSTDYLAIKTNCVIWKNVKFSLSKNNTCSSPDFFLDGLGFCFENYYNRDNLPFYTEHWTFAVKYKTKALDYVIIPYVETEGKFIRIATEIQNVRVFKSDMENKFKSRSGEITMLFLLSKSSFSTEVFIKETPFSILKDSGQESIKMLCLTGLSEDIGKLFNDVQSADATLKCADKSFSVHRKILAARSEVFSAMFQHDLSEKNTGVVDIVDLDSNILEYFLRYLYTGKIEQMSMSLALELYQVAEKYSVSTLKYLCATYILDNLSKDILYEALILADKIGDVEFMDGIASFAVKIEGFLKSTEWEEFAKKFPSIALEVFFKHFKQQP